MGMAADDDIDIRDLGDQGEIAGVTDMGQRDDLVDALALQILNGRGNALDVIGDRDVRAGGGKLCRVIGDGADDTDLLAGDIEHQRGLYAVAELEAAVALTFAVTTGNCTLSRKVASPSSLSSNS